MRTRLGALLLLLLAATGCAGATPYRADAATAAHRVALVVERTAVGATPVAVTVTDPAGAPVAAQEVRFSAVMTAMGHAAEPATATAGAEPGRFALVATFPMSGVWDVEVDVTAAGSVQTAAFRIPIGSG